MHSNSPPVTAFTLFALLLLTAPLNLLSSPSSSSSLVNAQPTSSGTINLYKDDLGFYIYAYNTPYNSDASDNTPNANGIPMMIGLYTSKTAFMTNCLNFSNYSCNSPTCEPFQSSQARQDYPYFKAKGYEASTYLYLDSDYWTLSGLALIATSCQSNTSTTFGSSRYGILGMGFWMNSAWNFRNNITFAVSIAPDLSSAELKFLQSATQIDREQVTQALIADENWWIQHENGSLIQMGDFNITTNFTFFFDLGADTIGFPHSLFEPLMDYYREEVFLACNHAFIRPQCTYNDSIENLPNITITIQNSTFVIPPSVYIQNASSITGVADTVTLNLRAVGQHLTGDSYAMPNSMNNIIFDINFMSYYYVVFNVTQEGAGLITLYQNQEIPSLENNSYALYIIFGCIGLMILMAIAYCVFRCFYKKKKGLQSQGRYSRVHQTNVQEALNMDSNVQSVLLAHHSNELRVEKVE